MNQVGGKGRTRVHRTHHLGMWNQIPQVVGGSPFLWGVVHTLLETLHTSAYCEPTMSGVSSRVPFPCEHS